MTKRAKSAFTIDKRDAQPAVWEGGQMGHSRFEKTFTGELTGTSVVEAIMLRTDNEGPAVYAGVERFDCTLDGRKGTFLLLHSATMRGGHQEASWKIVSGSGTGELAGIRRHGEIHPNHDFILTYEIESSNCSCDNAKARTHHEVHIDIGRAFCRVWRRRLRWVRTGGRVAERRKGREQPEHWRRWIGCQRRSGGRN